MNKLTPPDPKVRLFANVGKAPALKPARQISQWDEWAGPEDPSVLAAMGPINESLETLSAEMGGSEIDRALEIYVEWAKQFLPYNEDGDAWDATRTAAWHAAGLFLLASLYEQKATRVPEAMEAQLSWFRSGHWPCALALTTRPGDPSSYIVY